MRQPVLAGVAYFGCMFAVGFTLGVVRVAFIVPLLGELLSISLELPVILLTSWVVCQWLTSRLTVPAKLIPRSIMGVVAFVLLMVGELSISVLLSGRSTTEHLRLYAEYSHIIGLAGQLAFAVLPILQIWISRTIVNPVAFSGPRKEVLGVLVAVALYATWTTSTWFFEGRVQTLLRPDSAVDRVIYAVVANLLVGLVAGMLLLGSLIRRKVLTGFDAGVGLRTPSAVGFAIALVFGFTNYAVEGAPTWHPIVLINVFAQVLVVSAAEVLVCWAIAGAAIESCLRPAGRPVAMICAGFVSSILFGLYHFAHSAPFNTPSMVVLLTLVGLSTSLFFFLTRDVYATIVFHNFLGMLGVVQALEASGQLNVLKAVQPPFVAMALATAGLLAMMDWTILRRSGDSPVASTAAEADRAPI
jgi:hypothetical protein